MFVDYSATVTVTDEDERDALKKSRDIIHEILETMDIVGESGFADFATYKREEVAQVAHILTLLIESIDEGGILIS